MEVMQIVKSPSLPTPAVVDAVVAILGEFAVVVDVMIVIDDISLQSTSSGFASRDPVKADWPLSGGQTLTLSRDSMINMFVVLNS